MIQPEKDWLQTACAWELFFTELKINLRCHFEVFVWKELKLNHKDNFSSRVFWGTPIQADLNSVMLWTYWLFPMPEEKILDTLFWVVTTTPSTYLPHFLSTYSGLLNSTSHLHKILHNISFTVCLFLWNTSHMKEEILVSAISTISLGPSSTHFVFNRCYWMNELALSKTSTSLYIYIFQLRFMQCAF